MCWCADEMMWWWDDVMMCWCADEMMCWCADLLMRWCDDGMMCWFADEMFWGYDFADLKILGNSSLFTVHSSLFTFHFSLFTFHFSLFKWVILKKIFYFLFCRFCWLVFQRLPRSPPGSSQRCILTWRGCPTAPNAMSSGKRFQIKNALNVIRSWKPGWTLNWDIIRRLKSGGKNV